MTLATAYLKFSNFYSFSKQFQFVNLPAKEAWSTVVFNYLNEKQTQNNILVCENEHDLIQRIDELKPLFPSFSILHYPSLTKDETIIKTASKKNQQRKEVFQKIIEKKSTLIVTTSSVFLEKLPSLKTLTENKISIEKNIEIDLDQLKEKLIDFGFEQKDTVTTIGEFSVRGFIIDVFSYFYDNPIRIELWGQTIESIRLFDVFSQRSIEILNQIKIESLSENHLNQSRNTYHLFDFFKQSPSIIIENELDWTQTLKEHSETNNWSLDIIEQKIQQSNQLRGVNFESSAVLNLNIESEPEWQSFEEVKFSISHFLEKKYKIFLIVQDENEKQLFIKKNLNLGIQEILIGTKYNGFIQHNKKVVFLSYHNIFFQPFIKDDTPSFKGQGVIVPSFQSFQKKDWVIHEHYGIGQFIGIKKVTVQDHSIDCLLLQYADKGSLTLPVTDFKKISKYLSQDQVQPKLAQLGRKIWEQKKKKAKKAILKLAQDLIDLYAKRKSIKGFSFKKDSLNQQDFEENFPYTLTPDQNKAILETKLDMEKPYPMDRLICGDVGFGKTEVALRATFKCVDNGKQAVLMAPTTLLSQQLFSQFERRISSWSIQVGCLNRFQTTKEQRITKEKLKQGQIDIIVGTHKVLSKDVEFKNLGLIIIDEEQKFGVRQKEILKEKYFSVDSISLSATPIPRSLHLSFLNIRPFSIIQTPPQNRLSIETHNVSLQEKPIVKILTQEKNRGGQSFFVYNRVEDLFVYKNKLQKWLPDFKIAMVHGKLPEKELEKIMLNFVRNKYDILVCTSIIEAGIDLSNVNTIIIHHPEYFGISELFQLRGRVGRSSTQAYCYLTLSQKSLSDHSQTRINMLKKFTALGSGYALAVQDLEIRGVGNILGTEQKGHLYELGYHTYCQLIQNAVKEIQGKPTLNIETKIDYPQDAFLNQDYIENSSQRIDLYQKISWIDNIKGFDDLSKELLDRFGKIPLATQNLILIAKLSWLSRSFNLTDIQFQGSRIILTTNEGVHSKILKNLFANLPFPFNLTNTTPLQIVCVFPSAHPQSNLIQLNTILKKLI